MKTAVPKGFTLVELIIVMVVLGILAAIAASRFIDISTDARVANIRALASALRTGSELVHTKAIIQGLNSGNKNIDIDGDGKNDIALRAGFPRVGGACRRFVAGLDHWLDIKLTTRCTADNTADWYGIVKRNAFHFFPTGYNKLSQNCYVTYVTASRFNRKTRSWQDTDAATIRYATSGC